MNKPPNKMHKGEEPGLDEADKAERLVDVAKKDGSTSEMDRPDPMDPEATIRSNA